MCAQVLIVLAAYPFPSSIVPFVCPFSWLDQGDLAAQLIRHLLIQFMIAMSDLSCIQTQPLDSSRFYKY